MQKIVVDITDPTHEDQPALEAAIAAASEDASFVLFHNLYHRNIIDQDTRGDEVLTEARELLLKAREEKLAHLGSKYLGGRGCTTSPVWAKAGWQELIRYAIQKNCDLVVSESEHRTRWQRLRLGSDDWELIRHCPVPLLFARSSTPKEYHKIVAAVDPLHADDKPAELDRLIVRYAADCAHRISANLHLLNVAQVAVTVPPIALEPIATTVDIDSRVVENHKEALHALAQDTDIADCETTVRVGIPGDEIVAFAHEQKTDLLVMGAVSRSALGRLLIGNTAERVLDELPCDVLIIKPPHFDRKTAALVSLVG